MTTRYDRRSRRWVDEAGREVPKPDGARPTVKTKAIPSSQRKRPRIETTLGKDALDALDRLVASDGTNRGAVIERLVLREAERVFS